jgi:hypothetical protein
VAGTQAKTIKGATMSRDQIQGILARQQKDEAWYQAVFTESLMCFIEDKDPKSCIDRLRPLIDEGPENLKAHGRLLMGHAYRSMGRQRLAIFNYQAVARRKNIDEATIIALAALTEIGDASSQKLAQSRIDLLRQQDPAPSYLDLLDGGTSLQSVQEILSE